MTTPIRLWSAADVREHLGRAQRVLVTGPQRSGTTFAGHALAATLGLPYVDEAVLRSSDEQALAQLLAGDEPWVLQAPGMTHLLHRLPADSGVHVVWMRRPVREVEASQRRVGWTQRGEPELERAKYAGLPQPPGRIREISRYKLWHWHSWQAATCPLPCYELPYRCPYLVEHELWVDDSDRAGWHIKQVRPE